jgi:transcription initiation factor TFIIA large subunit
MSARERAAQSLHESYGQRAGAQIAQLQSQQGRVPTQIPPNSTGPYIKQEDPQPSSAGVPDYHSSIPPQSAAGVNSSQTDGANDAHDDWKIEHARRKALARAQGSGDDQLMKAQFLAHQRELEGGGLLARLDERAVTTKALRRKLHNIHSEPSATPAPHLARVQGDAAGDDDDEIDDEDAINSDLDDPDDLAGNDEEAENTDQVMLCTYDKVQRVKNKWKCTLKDGVLRVEGNE